MCCRSSAYTALLDRKTPHPVYVSVEVIIPILVLLLARLNAAFVGGGISMSRMHTGVKVTGRRRNSLIRVLFHAIENFTLLNCTGTFVTALCVVLPIRHDLGLCIVMVEFVRHSYTDIWC